MHRSGTSAVARCLMESGLSFTLDGLEDGYWDKHVEYYQVNQLNEKIVGSWKSPRLPQPSLRSKFYKYKVHSFIRQHVPQDKWIGIKDPRMLLTYDLWAPYFDEKKIIGIIRRPEEVAQSLSIRDDYARADFEAGLELWRIHNQELLNLRDSLEFPILNFNLSKQDFGMQLQAACSRLEIPYSADAFDRTFTDDKKHHEALDIPTECRDVYDRLKHYSETGL
jgi:hypothetical protein